MLRAAITVALLVAAASRANAQGEAKLRATTTFRCVFTTSAKVNMDGDVPRVTTVRDNLEAIFDQVDARNGSGRLIGNQGAESITVVRGSEKITLLEVTPNGTVQVTVIYSVERSDGQFKAVHSRHTAAPDGIPIASQMYGSCRALH